MSDPRPHVLATERDPALRDLLTALLVEAGCRVSFAAPDPAEVRRLAPDLVLLDFLPAGLGAGWGALEGLRTDPVAAAVPVLVLTTAHQEAEAAAGRLAALGVGVVIKPFEVDDLLDRVARALAGLPPPPPEVAA